MEKKDIQIEEIEITTDFIKLDSLLKFSGAAETGGQAKDIIQAGEVFVNGEICLMRGKKIKKGDKVYLEGLEIRVV